MSHGINKLAALSVFQQQEDNRQFFGYYKKLSIPALTRGNQRLENAPKVGQTVEMLPSATMRGSAKVKETYQQNGFVYVVTDKLGTQRMQDVKVVDLDQTLT